jgi:hypothetical protein
LIARGAVSPISQARCKDELAGQFRSSPVSDLFALKKCKKR